MNTNRIETIEELIHFVAFGDTYEAAYIFHDDPPETEYPCVRLPINRPEELRNGKKISLEEEIHFNMLAILIAFKEKRLGQGGHILNFNSETKHESPSSSFVLLNFDFDKRFQF